MKVIQLTHGDPWVPPQSEIVEMSCDVEPASEAPAAVIFSTAAPQPFAGQLLPTTYAAMKRGTWER